MLYDAGDISAQSPLSRQECYQILVRHACAAQAVLMIPWDQDTGAMICALCFKATGRYSGVGRLRVIASISGCDPEGCLHEQQSEQSWRN
jgi:hypothetical protein